MNRKSIRTIRRTTVVRKKDSDAKHTRDISKTMQIDLDPILTQIPILNVSRLDIESPNQPILRIPLDRRPVRLGRNKPCEIIIPLTNISREHAVIEFHGEEYRIQDLDSTNGTFVNGIRIAECVLRNHDVIRIGGAVITFIQQRNRG